MASSVILSVVRIVLDTAAFVAAVRSSDGAASEVLRRIFTKQVVPLMDLKLALEYRAVALRSEHIAASRLSRSEIEELIEAVEAFAEPVEVIVKTRPLSSDPDDDMVLDVAINGQAESIVTGNKKDFLTAGKRFRIAVFTPAEFLVRMREANEDGG